MSRWNPFKEVEELEKRLSHLLGRSAPAGSTDKNEAITVAQWSPVVDISEDDKEYAIKAALPDVKKEDIKLNVHDDVLTITGERKYEKEEGENIIESNAYGSFMRSLPCRRTPTGPR
jgi:HSP20 family protein